MHELWMHFLMKEKNWVQIETARCPRVCVLQDSEVKALLMQRLDMPSFIREHKILNVCAELWKLLLLDINVSQKKTSMT